MQDRKSKTSDKKTAEDKRSARDIRVQRTIVGVLLSLPILVFIASSIWVKTQEPGKVQDARDLEQQLRKAELEEIYGISDEKYIYNEPNLSGSETWGQVVIQSETFAQASIDIPVDTFTPINILDRQKMSAPIEFELQVSSNVDTDIQTSAKVYPSKYSLPDGSMPLVYDSTNVPELTYTDKSGEKRQLNFDIYLGEISPGPVDEDTTQIDTYFVADTSDFSIVVKAALIHSGVKNNESEKLGDLQNFDIDQLDLLFYILTAKTDLQLASVPKMLTENSGRYTDAATLDGYTVEIPYDSSEISIQRTGEGIAMDVETGTSPSPVSATITEKPATDDPIADEIREKLETIEIGDKKYLPEAYQQRSDMQELENGQGSIITHTYVYRLADDLYVNIYYRDTYNEVQVSNTEYIYQQRYILGDAQLKSNLTETLRKTVISK